MLLHVTVPGFQAAVHQALDPSLRGRPVVVAIDGGPQAPMIDCSVEAHRAGIRPGLRADVAARRLPTLVVRTPDPACAQRAHHALVRVCATCAPRVGGRAGELDIDLAGTEPLWSQRLEPGKLITDAAEQALLLARRCYRDCVEQLHLRPVVGVGARVFTARLAARLALGHGTNSDGILLIPAEAEAQVFGPVPIDWLPGCQTEVCTTLRECGITRLGDLLRLSPDDITAMVGHAGAGLYAIIHGEAMEAVPDHVEPEPAITTSCHCGKVGAGTEMSKHMVRGLSRELGVTLRERCLALTLLRLDARWMDGRWTHATQAHRYQSHHDQDVEDLALKLLAKIDTRRVHFGQFRLIATGLCAAEQQQDLFGPGQDHRIERLQDRVRTKFGRELVTTLRAAITAAAGV